MKRTVYKDVGIAVNENEDVIFIEALDGTEHPIEHRSFPKQTCDRCGGTKELSRNIMTHETFCAGCALEVGHE